MDNQEVKDEGVSLGEIFSWIYKGKLIGLIVLVVLFVLVFVGVRFIYNPSKQVYNIKVSYSNVFDDDKYPNGSTFNYLDLIRKNNLEAAKVDSGVDIDVDSLLYGTKSSITVESINVYLEPSDTSSTITDTYYSINVSTNAFKSEEDARNFLISLAEAPLNNALEMVANDTSLTDYLAACESALTFENELSNIDYVVNKIKNGYTSLITKYGDVNVSVLNEASKESVKYGYLSQLNNEFSTYLESVNYNLLSYELNNKGWIKPTPTTVDYQSIIDNLDAKLKGLEARKADLDAIIKTITAGGITVAIPTEVTTELLSITKEIQETKLEIAKYETMRDKLDNPEHEEGSAAFDSKLSSIESALLNKYVATYRVVNNYLYNLNASVNYYNSGIVISEGGFSTIITLALGLGLGLVVGVVVAGFVGYNSFKKQKLAKEGE